jgi:hypothetical protein
MYAGITEVRVTDDYRLILTFENNERRLFDLSPYLNVGRFAELRDKNVFKQISIPFDTVEWENGLDIDPEFLYAKSEQIVESSVVELAR